MNRYFPHLSVCAHACIFKLNKKDQESVESGADGGILSVATRRGKMPERMKCLQDTTKNGFRVFS